MLKTYCACGIVQSMSAKNVLFGLGIGLVCSGLVLIFYNKSGSGISDAEIKKRAAELGMVEDNQNAILTSELEKEKMDEDNGNNDTVGGSEKEKQELPEKTESEDSNDYSENPGSNDDTGEEQIEENNDADSPSKEKDNNSSNEKNTEKKKKNNQKTTVDTVNSQEKNSPNTENNSLESSSDKKKTKKSEGNSTITIEITKGMTAEQICQKMEEKGLIEDAEEFRNYISRKNMQRSLRAGTYEIDSNAEYDEILEVICKA